MSEAPIGVSLAQQIKCVEREVQMRELEYPSRVRQRKMADVHAKFEIAAMRAVLATLKALASGA